MHGSYFQATNPVGTSLCSDIVSEEDLELNNALEMLKTAKLSHLKVKIPSLLEKLNLLFYLFYFIIASFLLFL